MTVEASAQRRGEHHAPAHPSAHERTTPMSFPLPLVPARPDMFTLDEAVTRIRAALRVRRRNRLERRRWQEAAATFDRLGGPAGLAVISTDVGDFSGRPYLVVHPEREIAEAGEQMWHCEACRVSETYFMAAFFGTPGRAQLRAIAAAHRHNAARHPRRHARAQQHFSAPIPAEVRDRAEAHS